jgi:hypothetical protein
VQLFLGSVPSAQWTVQAETQVCGRGLCAGTGIPSCSGWPGSSAGNSWLGKCSPAVLDVLSFCADQNAQHSMQLGVTLTGPDVRYVYRPFALNIIIYML